MERYSITDITSEDLKNNEIRNRVAVQLETLMKHIVSQWYGRCPLDRDLIESQARYGIVLAMENYRDNTSQTFFQYAGWCIRHSILNGISKYSSTVKIGYYGRKQLTERGETTCRMVYIDRTDDTGKEDRNTLSEIAYTEDFDLVTRDEAIDRLIKFVESTFADRYKEVFFCMYGLNGYDTVKETELARKFNCSTARISQMNRKVLNTIRSNADLMELLDSVRML